MINPIPRPEIEQKVKSIYPQAYPKWNVRYKRWDIVDKHIDGFEIILMAVRNDDGSYRSIDRRTFHQLRFMRWFNNKPARMKQMMIDMVDKGEADDAKAFADQQNDIRDVGAELAPLLRQMARDTGFSAYGKPVPYGRGIGAGTFNQQLGRRSVTTV